MKKAVAVDCRVNKIWVHGMTAAYLSPHSRWRRQAAQIMSLRYPVYLYDCSFSRPNYVEGTVRACRERRYREFGTGVCVESR